MFVDLPDQRRYTVWIGKMMRNRYGCLWSRLKVLMWTYLSFSKEDTISINHNWTNACGIFKMWEHVQSELKKVPLTVWRTLIIMDWSVCYVSVRTRTMVNLEGRWIQNFVLVSKMSLEKKFQILLKNQDWNREKVENADDIPDFREISSSFWLK